MNFPKTGIRDIQDNKEMNCIVVSYFKAKYFINIDTNTRNMAKLKAIAEIGLIKPYWAKLLLTDFSIYPRTS